MEVLMVNGDRVDMVDKMTNDSAVNSTQDGREGEPQEERMDTSTIDSHDMDSLRTEGEESAMPGVQLKPIKSEDNQHAIASHVYGQVEEAEIEKFLKEHPPTKDDAHRRDIKVAELRRIIPLLIIKLFNVRKDPTQKKVKGMWNERPKNWPAELPYCDPNNHLKGEKGKPNQKVLLRMFSYLMKNYMESIGMPYPDQEVSVSPIVHHFTASGSPVAIASKPHIKMENRDAMVLGTSSLVPSSVTDSDGHGMSTENLVPVQSMVTSAMSHPITSVSGVVPEQPKLHALLHSSTIPMKSRTKAPTVRELLPNNPTPQVLQPAIIIKPSGQIVHHVNQSAGIAGQGHIVNSQAFQAVQTMPDGQKYILQSLPVLTQGVVPVSVSGIESYPDSTMVTAQMSQVQDIVSTRSSATPIPVPAPKPSAAFTEPVACQSNSPPMDTNPLSVLSATAAKKQPLPVPNTSNSQAQQPPPSNLHVIQPAHAQHEMMDTSRAVEENTPVQVDEEDWEPFDELKTQCSKKLKRLEHKGYLDSANSARLNIIKDLLDKMYMVREHDPEFFISTAHEFVSTLDIIKATRKVPEVHMTKWKEFEGYCKERLLEVLRKAYPRYLKLVEQYGLPKHGAWYKAMNTPHSKTPMVTNEVEVNTTTSEKGSSSGVGFEDLGITPMTPVTLGTMEQLQKNGELNLRIIHDGDRANEVEAIKNELKSLDVQVMSPRASSVDGHSSLQEPATPGSTCSKDHLEDLEQVIILDSLKDAFNREQKQKASMAEYSGMVPPSLYVSVDDPPVCNPMMDYRNPTNALSPQVQPEQLSPIRYSTPVQHRDDGQPVGVHWTQLNGQPPGLTHDTSCENSIAAELLDKISAEGIADKRPNLSGRRQGEGMRKLAEAYLNQLAMTKRSNYGDDYGDGQLYSANNTSGIEENYFNNDVEQRSINPTLVDEVQTVFEKSDMIGPPPAKKAALKRRCPEETAY